MTEIINKYRFSYIDVLKGIAILAVIFDHGLYIFFGLTYSWIQAYTYFSVAWFIFLSGVTSAISASKQNYSPVKFITSRLKYILYYLLTSVVLITLMPGNKNIFFYSIYDTCARPIQRGKSWREM